MKRIEDWLMDGLCFGHSHLGKNTERLHIPTFWEVSHDLAKYVNEGLLVEIPGSCSLADIFELERNFYKSNASYSRLLESDYTGRVETVQFRSVPGNTLYQLEFSKADRTPLSGHFRKISEYESCNKGGPAGAEEKIQYE